MIHNVINDLLTNNQYQAVVSREDVPCKECALKGSLTCCIAPCTPMQRLDKKVVIYKQRLTIKKYKELKNAQ